MSQSAIPEERPKKELDDNGRLIIDGSLLEGGGQILRNCGSLSCILGIPIKVINIRAGRQKPGLRPQHMTGLQLIAQICQGTLNGCVVGSTEITLDPGQIAAGQYTADTKTAGSICLLMQIALPCLLYGKHESTLQMKGGTNCDMAPQIDYTTLVFKPIAQRFGMHFDVDIRRRGYFPKGGGDVTVTVRPTLSLVGIEDQMMNKGDVVRIYSRSFVAGALPQHLSDKVSRTIASNVRRWFPQAKLQQDALKEPDGAAIGSGLGTIVTAETSTGCLFGGSALGKPRSRAEDSGEAAAKELKDGLDCGGSVDSFLQDQLVLLMALAKGQTRVKCGKLTLHTQTAIHMARLMTEAKFEVEDSDDGTCIVSCTGIGHANTLCSDKESQSS